ncbi:MAG TPA: LCP family protein [Anaerolineales bacterium]|nr:LCP family protein [Anaerolineales bacterium]
MKTKSFVGLAFLGLIMLGILGMTVWAVKAYQSPLGPSLDLPTPTTIVIYDQIIPTAIPINNQIAPTATPVPTQVPTAIPTATQPGSCGETAIWNILILGSDAGDMRGEKGSDLTRMARVDFINKKVTIYSFSRDLWVDTTGLNLNYPMINATKLGRVFYEGRVRSPSLNVKTQMVDGTKATADMLARNFLINTDHYLTIDLSQIPAMIDAIGGVPVNVPVQTTDPWIGTVIPAGQQSLNGAQFVAYARAIPDSDFGRIERNNLLVKALQQKLLDPNVWIRIPQLYMQFSGVIATDLSPEQINHLTCLLTDVPPEAVVQEGVRQEWTYPGPQPGSLFWDRTIVTNRLRELGLIP